MTESRFEHCISQIRSGEPDGLKEIYESYYKLIYTVVYSVTANSEDAEDITADFFIKLWERLVYSYKAGNGHKAWLAAVARNMATDLIRRKNRHPQVPTDRPSEEDAGYTEPVSPQDLESEVISSMTVSRALQQLDDSEREIVTLKLFAELKFREISKTLGIPLGTVTWRYRNAVKKLKQLYQDKGGAQQ